jgi:hypothetical protein
MDETVTLTISKDEALILFVLLVDFFDEPAIIIKDNADRMALSRLGGTLEKTLVEPFMENYTAIASDARKRLIEAWGESPDDGDRHD